MYDSLHRNLRLWSVTPNESSFGKIGHDESGSKQEFISFYNFLATVHLIFHFCYNIIQPEIAACFNDRFCHLKRHRFMVDGKARIFRMVDKCAVEIDNRRIESKFFIIRLAGAEGAAGGNDDLMAGFDCFLQNGFCFRGNGLFII